MKPRVLRWSWATAGYVALGLTALVNGGCLVAAAGVAGGAALGYVYHEGKVSQTYNASLDDSTAAAHAALTELGMPLLKEEHTPGEDFLLSHTADGDKVRIYLSQHASKFQAEGPLTCVGVRVATFGNYDASARLLSQIGAHLAPPPGQPPPLPLPAPAIPPQARAPAAAPQPGPPGAPPQTPPPPLAN
jgi:hypothetical protein